MAKGSTGSTSELVIGSTGGAPSTGKGDGRPGLGGKVCVHAWKEDEFAVAGLWVGLYFLFSFVLQGVCTLFVLNFYLFF
jgi:hypothetical protein